MHVFAAHLLLVAFTGVVALDAASGRAGLAQTPTRTDVHIELTVTHWPEESGHTLSAGSLLLSQNGQGVPFHLSGPKDRSGSPVHLLLLAPGETAAAIWSAQETALSPVWAQGWLVSIAGSDRSTPYVTDAPALAAALAAPSADPVVTGSALQRLGSFAGRRIVIVTGSLDRSVPLALPSARSSPETYIVDGGKRAERTFDPVYLFGMCNFYGANSCPDNETYFSVGNPQISPSVTTGTRQNGFDRGVWHGDRLRAAVREALRVSRSYFDLQAGLPAAALGSPLNLQFRKLPAGLRIRAEAYAEHAGQRGTEPRLVLSQR